MEFNWINLFNASIVVLMLIPNIIYAIKNKNKSPKTENKTLSIVEQIGRYACMILMILPLFIKEFGFNPLEVMFLYLVANIILLLEYFMFWGLFFKKQTKSTAISLSVIPTAIFFVTGACFRHWALMISALVFGFAHIKLTIKNYEEK